MLGFAKLRASFFFDVSLGCLLFEASLFIVQDTVFLQENRFDAKNRPSIGFPTVNIISLNVDPFITPSTVVAKASSEPEIGHGLGSTKSRAFFSILFPR